MASGAKKILQAANRVNDTLLPQFENLKQRKLGKSAYNVYADYKTVLVDFLKGVKNKPVMSAMKFGVVGAGYLVYRYNPDEGVYNDILVENSKELLQLSEQVRNPSSDSYTQRILQLHYQGRLQRQSIGLFSVMFVNDYSKDCDVYEKHCYYTSPRWLYLWQQVIDIGMFGHWFCLESSMENFDINVDDLNDCPDDVEEGSAFRRKVVKIGSGLVDFIENCYYSLKQSFVSSEP